MTATPTPRIFISYRLSDSADVAGRMYDWLTMSFGPDSVFKDVDSIPVGADFEQVIGERIAECDAVLVVIGPSWATAAHRDGRRRLDDSADLVRIEIEQAMARGIPVVPALIGHAEMPATDLLPESIRRLTRRNGIAIRPDPDFRRDMERLIAALKRMKEPAPAARPVSPSPTPIPMSSPAPAIRTPRASQNSPAPAAATATAAAFVADAPVRRPPVLEYQPPQASSGTATALRVIGAQAVVGLLGVIISLLAGVHISTFIALVIIAAIFGGLQAAFVLPHVRRRDGQGPGTGGKVLAFISVSIALAVLMLSAHARYDDLKPGHVWFGETPPERQAEIDAYRAFEPWLLGILALLRAAGTTAAVLWSPRREPLLVLKRLSLVLIGSGVLFAVISLLLPIRGGLLSGLATAIAIIFQSAVVYDAIAPLIIATLVARARRKAAAAEPRDAAPHAPDPLRRRPDESAAVAASSDSN